MSKAMKVVRSTTNLLHFDRGRRVPEDIAGDWIIRIDSGPLTVAERKDLHRWLAESPAHRKLLDDQALLWAAASNATFPAEVPSSTRIERSSMSRGKWAVALATAAVVVIVLTHWPAMTGLPTHDLFAETPTTYGTARAETRPVVLPDGSRTELSALSTLRLAYVQSRRRVVLESGEGLFDVVKDAKRPFEVQVRSTIVRAVGTRFLVRLRDDGKVDVTVYSGVVEMVSRADADRVPFGGALADGQASGVQALRLKAGQTAMRDGEQTTVADAAAGELARRVAWQRGRLEFENTPLAEVIAEANRYSAIPLRAVGTVGDLRLSGSYAAGDTAVLLRSLEVG